ncbi:hypothetical protein ACFOYW_00335 [Gryllotalpicola reticulitermitis]|uniref:Transmembrane protein n=1 Tax=Gryllotalpicola reticulitermitis TaxID=1184153 RepID=A0ABV8Q2C8_9MICO
MDQAWQGSPERIARYLPPGWFDLADIGPLRSWLPAWPWSVLHVQAALELPFVMLAYLLVCRWFGPAVFRRAIAARWHVSASYTLTFCLVEWELRNPDTCIDIVIRIVSGILTPLLLPLLSEGRAGAPRLVPFVVSAAALGAVVLAVYDTATLYNLAHALSWLPLVAAAAVVLAAARWFARRPAVHGPAMASVSRSLGWLLLLFFAPALPVRYGFNFGTERASLIAGAAIMLTALRYGWDHRLGGTLALAIAAGALGAGAGYAAARGYPEAKLLAAATGFVHAPHSTAGAPHPRAHHADDRSAMVNRTSEMMR